MDSAQIGRDEGQRISYFWRQGHCSCGAAIGLLGDSVRHKSCIHDRYEIRATTKWFERFIFEHVLSTQYNLGHHHHVARTRRCAQPIRSPTEDRYVDGCLLRDTRRGGVFRSGWFAGNRPAVEPAYFAVLLPAALLSVRNWFI